MLRAMLPLILTLCFSRLALPQHPLERLRRASHQGPGERGTLTMSFYPFGLLEKPISSLGERYHHVVGTEDLLARLVDLQTTQLREHAVDRAGLLTADKSSTTLLHARGRDLTFYPRLFQLHPSVIGFQLRPGDLVGSLSPMNVAQDSTVAEATYPTDRVFKFAFPRGTGKLFELPFEVPVVVAAIGGMPPRAVDPNQVEWLTFLYRLEEDLAGAQRFSDSTFPVAVLSRRRAGYHCKLISPLRLQGALRLEGDLWQTMTSGADEGAWESLLGFQGVSLASGDQIHVTTLEQVAPFHGGQ